jgi:hypothetical protein
LLDVNPVLWLTRRERWQSVTLWCVTAGIVGLAAAQVLSGNQAVQFTLNSFSNMLLLGLYVAVTAQACRFFVDARRSGLLEIILGTEMTAEEVVRGQSLALTRMLRWPLALCLCLQLIGTAVAQYSTLRQIGTVVTTTQTAAGTNAVVAAPATRRAAPQTWSSNNRAVAAVVSAIATTLVTLANVLALCWFGMRMGLSSKSTNIATLKTLAFVQVIPWFAITIVATFLIFFVTLSRAFSFGAKSAALMQWYPLLSALVAAVLCIGKDVAFIVWARKSLLQKVAARDW